MAYRTISDPIAQLTEALPGGLFRERLTAVITDDSSDVWQSLFRAFTPEGEGAADRLHLVRQKTNAASTENSWPLEKVEPGPWRSLGGCLDYTNWKDRERFMELDRAMAAAPHRLDLDDEEFLPTAA